MNENWLDQMISVWENMEPYPDPKEPQEEEYFEEETRFEEP